MPRATKTRQGGERCTVGANTMCLLTHRNLEINSHRVCLPQQSHKNPALPLWGNMMRTCTRAHTQSTYLSCDVEANKQQMLVFNKAASLQENLLRQFP